MYCVIQEQQLKKPNAHGAYKELITDSFTFTIGDVTKTKYTYRYGGERFERPIKTAYKISIHESKRVNGVVTKKQYSATTVDYYSLTEFWIGDCMIISRPKELADRLGTTEEHIWELINFKVDPLQERIKADFKKTEEYKTHNKHQKIINKHLKAKAKFSKMYACDDSEYDYCYNVYGELMNQTYLSNVISEYKQRCSYQQYGRSNYNDYKQNYSSYFKINDSNYSDEERDILKKFYRSLSKQFHPDSTGGDGTEMCLINKLKESWGI